MRSKSILLALSVIVFAATASNSATGQPVDKFYSDKLVTFLVGSEPGGGYDIYARALTRYLGRHIPGNPTIVTSNMPGAGSIKVTNHIYNQAPRDGSVIGNNYNGMTVEPLIGGAGVQFDVFKLNWLGGMGKQPMICVMWRESKIKTLQDAIDNEAVVGASAVASNRATMPKLFNITVGTKFKVITGYGTQDNFLAVERGEVEGLCGTSFASLRAAKPDWISENKVIPILQFALHKDPSLPNTPMLTEMVKDPMMRNVLDIFITMQEAGRPVIAPPGIPEDRLAALRKAVKDTLEDPEFLKDAEKLQLEIDYTSPAEIEKLLKNAYAAPKEAVAIATSVLGRSK